MGYGGVLSQQVPVLNAQAACIVRISALNANAEEGPDPRSVCLPARLAASQAAALTRAQLEHS